MRVRCALGLLVALLLAGCGEDEPRDRAAAPTKATPTASPTPTPAPDSGRLTADEIATLDRADKRVRRTYRSYERAMRTCTPDESRVRECIAAKYRPHARALRAKIAALETAQGAAAKQCGAQLEDAEDITRKRLRARDSIMRAIAERRYQDAIDDTRAAVDADIADEGAFEQIISVCEDI